MKNIYLIHGSDHNLIKKKANEICEKILPSLDVFSIDICEEQENKTPLDILADFIFAIQTPSFAERKVVWLKNATFFSQEGTKSSPSNIDSLLSKISLLLENHTQENLYIIFSIFDLSLNKSFYKSCKKLPNIEFLEFKQITLSDYKWQEQIFALIDKEAEERRLILSLECKEYLSEVIGNNTGSLIRQFDKIECYFTDKKITLEELKTLCVGNESSIFWQFSKALGKRSLKEALLTIDNLLQNSKNIKNDCIALMQQASNFILDLLNGRIIMQLLKLTNAKQITYALKNINKEQQQKLHYNSLLKMHPYRAQMLIMDSLKYKAKELCFALNEISNSSRMLFNTQTPAKHILENLAYQIIEGSKINS